ncbi:MAG TPA: ABC transporter substrate-binding protein [Bacillota bacterium]|nr:ABC transporter substrate-binding protein [Bacillota bacterium]
MNKKMFKQVSFLLALVLITSMLFAGCAPKEPAEPSAPTVMESKEPADNMTTAPASPDATSTMPVEPAGRVFKDSVGREVLIPEKLMRIAPSGPLAQIVLYTAAPELLCGMASKMSEEQIKLLGDKIKDLPTFGQFYGKNSDFNLEAVLAANTEAIVDIGEAKKTIKEDMDGMQQQINTPTIFIEATFAGMPKTYRDLGEMIGDSERTEPLAKYCEETLALCDKAKAEIPKDKIVKVYWAMGELGLNTNAVGSFHSELLDYIPVVNVADVEASSKGGGTEVSMEQIVQWDPDYILIGSVALAEEMKKDPAWSALPAMKENRIIIIPSAPYGFMGSPPSINRYLGVRWLGATFYPEIYKDSPEKQVKDFFKLFYHIEVDDAALAEILAGTFK